MPVVAKPGTLPRWATDLTNNDAPSSSQMDTGWTPGQTGVSDYDNYIKYWNYKWTEWENDGACDTTVTTIALSSGNNHDVSFGSFAGNKYFKVTAPANGGFYSPATFLTGISGGEDGREIIIVVNGTSGPWGLDLENTGSTAANRIWAPSNMQARRVVMPEGSAIHLRYVGALSRWVIITSAFAQAVTNLFLSATLAIDPTGTSTKTRLGYVFPAGTSCALYLPISLPIGALLGAGIQVLVDKTSGITTSLAANIAYVDGATGTATDEGDYTLTAAGIGSITINDPDTAMVDGRFYQIRIRTTATAGGGTGDTIMGAKLECYYPIV